MQLVPRLNQEKMYKRPTPRRTGCYAPAVPRLFDASSRIGAVLVNMQNTEAARPPPYAWRPPVDYEFVARHVPESERDAYLAKVAAWFAAHPAPVTAAAAAPPVINTDPVIALLARFAPHRPPIDASVVAWRSAGYTEAAIANAVRYYKWMEETADERQEALDAIFSKWVSVAKQVTRAKPKKAIKVVKKRL